jgi:hypothetical protein
MTEFTIGLVLGALLVFFTQEAKRWKNYIISSNTPDKTLGNTRWHNLMAYDGSERGQEVIE